MGMPQPIASSPVLAISPSHLHSMANGVNGIRSTHSLDGASSSELSFGQSASMVGSPSLSGGIAIRPTRQGTQQSYDGMQQYPSLAYQASSMDRPVDAYGLQMQDNQLSNGQLGTSPGSQGLAVGESQARPPYPPQFSEQQQQPQYISASVGSSMGLDDYQARSRSGERYTYTEEEEKWIGASRSTSSSSTSNVAAGLLSDGLMSLNLSESPRSESSLLSLHLRQQHQKSLQQQQQMSLLSQGGQIFNKQYRPNGGSASGDHMFRNPLGVAPIYIPQELPGRSMVPSPITRPHMQQQQQQTNLHQQSLMGGMDHQQLPLTRQTQYSNGMQDNSMSGHYSPLMDPRSMGSAPAPYPSSSSLSYMQGNPRAYVDNQGQGYSSYDPSLPDRERSRSIPMQGQQEPLTQSFLLRPHLDQRNGEPYGSDLARGELVSEASQYYQQHPSMLQNDGYDPRSNQPSSMFFVQSQADAASASLYQSSLPQQASQQDAPLQSFGLSFGIDMSSQYGDGLAASLQDSSSSSQDAYHGGGMESYVQSLGEYGDGQKGNQSFGLH